MLIGGHSLESMYPHLQYKQRAIEFHLRPVIVGLVTWFCRSSSPSCPGAAQMHAQKANKVKIVTLIASCLQFPFKDIFYCDWKVSEDWDKLSVLVAWLLLYQFNEPPTLKLFIYQIGRMTSVRH